MPTDNGHEILFGDIHNHNAYGYGVGSLERSIDIARTHLDFFAFTGHSSWHDMQAMEGGREQHWLRGFQRLKDGWPTVQQLIAHANRDGEFNTFLGFEWHSSHFGDQCVVFPQDHRPLHFPDHIDRLRAFCMAENALMIPHHLAYPAGRRGVNWAAFDPACTPVVEIYSEHGNSEEDRGGLPFFSHSMGGRQTSQTARHALDQGLCFGFVASSDSHSGFPGAYGEGLMAVLSKNRTRAAIIEGIEARRTYALTGDRIFIDFSVDGALMGERLRAGRQVEVAFDVQGRDEIDAVEIIHNGRIVHRAHPEPQTSLQQACDKPFQIRLEWGWGPWGDLALERVADWAFELGVSGARILRCFPCLQSGPFDEQRRHRFQMHGDNKLHIVSYTSRRGAYRQNPNQSVVLEISGSADAELDLRLTKPAERRTQTRIADLYSGSANLATGPFPKESYQWHRLLPLAASRVRGVCLLDTMAGPNYVYLRVKQCNGQLAWASPVFINYA